MNKGILQTERITIAIPVQKAVNFVLTNQIVRNVLMVTGFRNQQLPAISHARKDPIMIKGTLSVWIADKIALPVINMMDNNALNADKIIGFIHLKDIKVA